MREGLAVAAVGIVLVLAGAVKLAFGGFDGLFAIAVGALLAYAGAQDSRIKPMY
jgi:hypothetical protein